MLSRLNYDTKIVFGSICNNLYGEHLTFVLQAIDSDLDGSVNSQVFYSLPASSSFSIDSTTGEISTIFPLDYESRNEYVFIVSAIDSALDSRTGTASVIISVIDVQDQIPRFIETTVSIEVAETTSVGTVVASLQVCSV